MKNVFHFTLKGLFVLKISNFFPEFSGPLKKRFGQKAKVNFKIDDDIYWETNNYNIYIHTYIYIYIYIYI